MKRVLVVGSAGSGKSNFSKCLGQKTGLPVFHLDRFYWTGGWIERDKSLFVSDINVLVKKENWILDGNYKGTFPLRLTRADTVVFLDLNRMKCLWHVLKRTILSFGKIRDDMADGCPERFDWEFTKYIWRFPRVYRPILAEMLKGFEGDIICLRSLAEFRYYLANIKQGSGPLGR